MPRREPTYKIVEDSWPRAYQRLADRERRLHVSGGATSGDEREGAGRAPRRAPLVTAAPRPAGACAIPNSSPTPIKATTKEEPP